MAISKLFSFSCTQIDRDGNMRDIVGGSTLGGLSLLGLGALLTKAKVRFTFRTLCYIFTVFSRKTQ